MYVAFCGERPDEVSKLLNRRESPHVLTGRGRSGGGGGAAVRGGNVL